MTTYTRVNVPLPGGVKLPSLKLGAVGASIVLAPDGLSATGSTPAVWTEDISGTALTGATSGTTGTRVVGFAGQRAMQSGTTAAGNVPLNANGLAAIPLTDFTVAMVAGAQGYAYWAWLGGGYRISLGGGRATLDTYPASGLISAPIPATANTPVAVVARCAGAASTISSSTGAQNTGGTPLAVKTMNASPVVGRTGAEQTTQLGLFVLWPRVLTDAEVASVIAQQRANFQGIA